MGETIDERPEADTLYSSANEPALRSLYSGMQRWRRIPKCGAHAAGRRWRAKCSGVHACGVRYTKRWRAI
jgi:hypothetical protein